MSIVGKYQLLTVTVYAWKHKNNACIGRCCAIMSVQLFLWCNKQAKRLIHGVTYSFHSRLIKAAAILNWKLSWNSDFSCFFQPWTWKESDFWGVMKPISIQLSFCRDNINSRAKTKIHRLGSRLRPRKSQVGCIKPQNAEKPWRFWGMFNFYLAS